MTEYAFYSLLLRAWLALAPVAFLVLLRWPAPYGRHLASSWGTAVSASTGWLLMEAPASLLFLLWFVLAASVQLTAAHVVFFLLWQTHYLERAFHYPFTLGRGARPMPLVIAGAGACFNLVNSYLNGRYLFHFSPGYSAEWFGDPRFIIGVAIFVIGYAVNRSADLTLRRARTSTGKRYCQLESGLFRYVNNPNYLGELLVSIGWAIATWSVAGLSFAVWTAANLLPRGRSHLKWCRKHFADYPLGRKAVIPGVW